MDFARYFRELKFNANHDEKGRFSVGDGVGFASPNTQEGLNFHAAARELSGDNHKVLADKFKQVDELLGTGAKTTSGLGAWSDGAEDSTVTTFNSGVDYDTLKTSMAMKGLLANQKAVVVFKRDPAGKNSMYYTDVRSKDYAGLHESLLQAGVEFHTIVPTSHGARIWSFDSSDDGSGSAPFVKFARGQNVKSRVIHGNGEFLGSWTSREEGRQAYESQIATFFGQRRHGGRQLRGWHRLQSGTTKRDMIEAFL